MNVKNRTLFIADNLDIMRGMDSETMDLIYLDPPFNTKKQYKAPIGSAAEGAEFKDIWTDDDIQHQWHGEVAETNQELYQIIQASEHVYDTSMKIYLMAMAVRLFEMRRLLKDTGSIYLHCDPTASHYLKLVMDSLFGKANFRNEIVWYYKGNSVAKKIFPAKHDIILYYSLKQPVFNPVLIPYSESTLRRYNHTDENGRRYKISALRDGKQEKVYMKDGKLADDVWDIPVVRKKSERTGYPTQKPLALLDRIIKASSNENDVVFDPFCGCATACVAAERLNRQWIGVDISPVAETITKLRLQDEVDKQASLFNPLEDVVIATQPPIRTDTPETAVQRPLPAAHTHKHELFGIQEGRCKGCNLFLPFRNLTIDHIVAQSKGGTDHIENLQLLCQACNSTKGAGTQDQLIEKLKSQGVLG